MANERRVVILVTTPGPEEGRKVAEALVGEKLVACVNMVESVSSIYRWKGKVERDREALLIMKTRATLVERVIARVKELHSYEVPEVIVLPIEAGNPDYLKWIEEVTGQPG